MEADFDPYLILGVSSNASSEEIQKAYRRLVLTMHPDHNQNDPRAKSRFQQVQRAYDLLRDPSMRRACETREQSAPGDTSHERCPICHGTFQLSPESREQVFACPHCQAQLAMPGNTQTHAAPPPPPPPFHSFVKPSDFRLDKTKPRRRLPTWSYWTFLILGFLVYRGATAVFRPPAPKPLPGQHLNLRQPKSGSGHPAPVEPSTKSKQPAKYGFPIAASFTPVGTWVCERQTYQGEVQGVLIQLKLQFAKDGTYVLTKKFSGAGADDNPEEHTTGRWELSGRNVSLASPITLPKWIRTVKIEQQGLGGSAEHPSLNFKIAGHTWGFRRESKTPRTKYIFGLPTLDPVQLEPDSLDQYGPNYFDRVGTLQTW